MDFLFTSIIITIFCMKFNEEKRMFPHFFIKGIFYYY